MNFDAAFQILIGHEGGFVEHPRDPGGATRFGISQRSYPGEDIRNLTLDRAKTIYLRDYWGPAGCDAVPDGVKFSLFDMAVNSGVKPAIKCLQRAVDVDDDGSLGPITLQAVSSIHPSKFIARFNGHRLQFMSGLSNWPAFSRGWANRIAQNLMEA